MSAVSGSNVVTSGLVLDFDMSNTQKSFKGAPSTNLVYPSNTFNGGLWSGYCAGNMANATFSTTDLLAPDGTYTALKIVRDSGQACGATGTWGMLWGAGGTFTAGLAYTVSMWAKCQTGSVGITLGMNDYHGGGITLTTEWQRLSVTLTITANLDRGLQFIIPASSPTCYFWGAQLEQSSFMTPYIPTTSAPASRSTTQTILDLTNNNTITAGSLTYASDNTFSFNGATNYITTPNPITSSAPYTVLQWLKPDAALTDTVLTDGTSRKTPFVGPGPTWSPGYWMTARNFRVHCYTEFRDHTINLVGDTNWHLFGQWFDGTSCYGILDGVILSGGTRTAFTTGAVASFIIGAEDTTGNSYTWNGKIGVTQLYSRALSATEVAQNFNATRSRYAV